MNFEKYGVSSFAYQPTREVSATKSSLATFIEARIEELKEIANDPTAEAVSITALVRRDDASITARCITLDEDSAGVPQAASVDYMWRHRVPDSAFEAFGTMSDAIALLMSEDDDTGLITLDMGEVLVGNFCTGNCDVVDKVDEDEMDGETQQSDDTDTADY